MRFKTKLKIRHRPFVRVLDTCELFQNSLCIIFDRTYYLFRGIYLGKSDLTETVLISFGLIGVVYFNIEYSLELIVLLILLFSSGETSLCKTTPAEGKSKMFNRRRN